MRTSSPLAHDWATEELAFSCPGILSQPPFSMNSPLCQESIAPNSLSFPSWSGCFINWATQIAAWLAKTASSFIFWVVPAVDQPPHPKPMIIVMIPPQIRPQTPNLTFPAVSAFIDTSLNFGDILIKLDNYILPYNNGIPERLITYTGASKELRPPLWRLYIGSFRYPFIRDWTDLMT